MASLVGTGTYIISSNNNSSLTLTFSTGAAVSGDLVIAFWANNDTSLLSSTVLSSSSGTAYSQLDVAITSLEVFTSVWYRFLTSAETTVSSCATGGTAGTGTILSAIVLRGCKTNSSNIGYNSTTGLSSNPNSPSVTVYGRESAVMTFAGMNVDTTLTEPSGFANTVSTGATGARGACAAGLSYKSTDQGLTDPSSWTGGATGNWVAWTVTVESILPTWTQMTHYPNQIWAPKPMVSY